jgi:hypothetical protein
MEYKFSLKMSDYPHPYHLIWIRKVVEIKFTSVNLDLILFQVLWV